MADPDADPGGAGTYVPPPAPGSEGVDLSQPSLGTNAGDTTGGDSSSGSGEVESFDISGFPFKFNPPLHKSNRFVVTRLGEGSGTGVKSFYNDDAHNKYDASFAVRTDEGKTGFENLRLGRIIMDDIAISRGVKEGGVRYGFRFLYNPSKLGGSLNVGTDFIPNQQSTGSQVLQKGLEQMQLEVLLNRIPDINSNAAKSEYIPAISTADQKRLQEQGTQYDLDFLYRCANGIHNTRWRQQTGDIGVLLPNPCRLILGPYTSRGAVVSVQVQDEMFSGNMVPILSYVNITFARFLNMAQSETDRLATYGISQDGGDDSSGSSDTSTGNNDTSNSEHAPDEGASGTTKAQNVAIGKEMFNATNYGWSSFDWDDLVRLWNKESNWNQSAENKGSSTYNGTKGTGAYGIPQSMPGTKMKSEGSDWLTNPRTQIKWGFKYIKSAYGSPSKAWAHSKRFNWY